jgi:excisionase family DNA binding protein
MRSRIVSVFSEALAQSRIPVLDVATRYSELGESLLPLINPVMAGKYGLEMTSFVVENVSLPPEVEQAIDKRSSLSAIGNLNDYVKFQMAQGMAAGGGSPGGMATELAVGMAIAQQMVQQQGGLLGQGQAPAAGPAQPPPLPSAQAAPALDLLSPADAAKLLGVSEADVMASITAGELKAKKIGTAYRITRAALEQFLNG